MKQGIPADRIAPALILRKLVEQDLRFEELVAGLKDQLSRGTVNKYLNELLESKGRFKGFVERRGRRGPYYVPEKKRRKVELFLKREATKQRYNMLVDNVVNNATEKKLEELRKHSLDLEGQLAERDRIIQKLEDGMTEMVRLVKEGKE